MSRLSPTGPVPRVGATFGPYRIDRQLGAGGMGAVFVAHDQRLGRQVALKVLLGHHAQDPAFLQRFEHEATVMARLDSPHVLSIYDHGRIDGWPYLVTQYAAGGDLGSLIRERGPLPAPLAARVCSQVAEALVAAHAVGVLHRDVKPANVLLRDVGLDRLDRLHVYLADFGVASTGSTGSTGLTTAGAVAGTWNYLAPERAQGAPGSPASDVYSVGCLLWETLTGAPPYAGSDVEVAMAHLHDPVPQLAQVDDVTARANPVLARALAKDPARRQPSALVLREELRALSPSSVTPSFSGAAPLDRRHDRRQGRPDRPDRQDQHRRRWLIAVVATVALLAGGATTAYLVRQDPGATAQPGPDPAPPPVDDPGAGSPTGLPEAPSTITGDLTADGLGDLTYVDQQRGVTQVWTSTGAGFDSPRRRSGLEGSVLAGDLTGDGRLDLVDVVGDGPIYAVTVLDATGGRSVSPVELPDGSYDEAFATGDFDGDGHDDLAGIGYGDGRVQIGVAPGSGTGDLRPARRWFDGRVGGADDLALAVGDLDADGDDDLVLLAFDGATPSLRLLTAQDGAFVARGATPQRRLDDTAGLLRVADLEGDGTPEVVFVPRFGYDEPVRVWDYERGFVVKPGWTLRRDESVMAASVSDVDGDARDDLVLWTDEGDRPDALVVRSDGDRFATPSTWLRGQSIDNYGYAVDRVSDLDWSGYGG